ncbi:MAG: class I SAM-dependent methyltransferase [Bacillota bacterium]
MSAANYSKHAATWDSFSGDRSDEVDCWARLAASYGSVVLAAMAATAEVAADLAQRGFRVLAADVAPEMIAEAKRKRGHLENLTLVLADVRSLDLDRRDFDFTFIGTASFHHLLTASDREAALRSIRDHLRPGGGLGLELWCPSAESWATSWKVFEPVDTPAGASGRVFKRGKTEYDASSRIISISQEVFVEGPGGSERFTHSFSLQLLDRGALYCTLSGAGFRVEAEYGLHDLTPPTPESSHWIIEAVREG